MKKPIETIRLAGIRFLDTWINSPHSRIIENEPGYDFGGAAVAAAVLTLGIIASIVYR